MMMAGAVSAHGPAGLARQPVRPKSASRGKQAGTSDSTGRNRHWKRWLSRRLMESSMTWRAFGEAQMTDRIDEVEGTIEWVHQDAIRYSSGECWSG